MDASWTCVETCIGWPNGLASFLTSTRKSQKKKRFKADISCISLANNTLMDVTQLALTWGWVAKWWKTCFDLRANLISTKVSASHRKSTQVHASPGQTGSQVDLSFQLASTCESVWSGLYTILVARPVVTRRMIRCAKIKQANHAAFSFYWCQVSVPVRVSWPTLIHFWHQFLLIVCYANWFW